jgi:hypothetical protein
MRQAIRPILERGCVGAACLGAMCLEKTASSAALRIRLGDAGLCPLALHRASGGRRFTLHHGER